LTCGGLQTLMGQKRIVRIVSLINATNRSEKGHQPAQFFEPGVRYSPELTGTVG